MYAAFVKLLNMSAASGILIAVVIALRFLLRKVPKKYICILWALVALRMVCPFSISSPASAYNYIGSMEQSGQIEYIRYSADPDEPKAVVTVLLPVESEKNDGPTVSYGIFGLAVPVLFTLWTAGFATMLLYAAYSVHRVRVQVRESIPLDSVSSSRDLFLCDCIPTPFILGVLKPKIYLPSALDIQQQSSVIAHERAHISRLDHWWKPLGFFLLSVHWFNPLVWAAYALLCRDIEMACDEKVIEWMTPEQKKAYSTTLLTCSMPKRAISACPLAFGESGVAARIRGIARYRKPTAPVITAAILVCFAVSVLFLTNPLTKPESWAHLRRAGMIHKENGEELFLETVPPELMAAVTQEELDRYNGIFYQSAVLLEDGSAIYKMTREQYAASLAEIEDRLERICRGMPESAVYSASIRSITHNADYSDFTVTVKNGTQNDFDAEEVADYILTFARRYSLYTTGNVDREITIRYQDASGHPAQTAAPNYRLRIAVDGVASITVYDGRGRAYYGYGHALGSAYTIGESRSLPCLDGLENLNGVQILAKDASDHILWQCQFTGAESFPWAENGWQVERSPSGDGAGSTDNYHLLIGSDDIAVITVDSGSNKSSFRKPGGGNYSRGESLYLSVLTGLKDISGVRIWAEDESGNRIWEHSLSSEEAKDGWQLIHNPDWIKIDTPADIRNITHAMFLMDVQETTLDLLQMAQLEAILRSATKLETDYPLPNSFDCILQIVQRDGRYRSLSLTTNGSNLLHWGGDCYQLPDPDGFLNSLLFPGTALQGRGLSE